LHVHRIHRRAVSSPCRGSPLEKATWNKAGLLMTFDLQHNGGTLWLYLSEARARLQIHKSGRILTDVTA
ncbi:hypothetical protein M9458_022510, partial [Cirrhinus mrigala]